MPTLTVNAKGQVTLCKNVLKHVGVHSGDEIAVNEFPNGRIEVRAVRDHISDIFDLLKGKDGPRLSNAGMEEAAAWRCRNRTEIACHRCEYDRRKRWNS
jgi:bifunctional DNA-binding transcriptional regulator/antitoxin component of YhaV-PrlF toxin-antitoxin module